MLHIATEKDILAGKVTDVYFERTRQVLQAEKLDAHVVAEFVVKKFPRGRSWGVFAGLEEATTLLENLPIKVWSVPEGTIFRPHEPIFIIEGNYLDFGRYETALLGFFCQASGIATQAARCRIAAGDRPVISFGARRMHPSIAPMIERNAYIGGCNGVATIKSAELLELKPSGTVPHALILIMGDTVKAMNAFDTSLSNAPVLDYSMDLVEINGTPIAKRGKTSGRKDVRRCPTCFRSEIVPWGAPPTTCEVCHETMPSLLRLIWDGEIMATALTFRRGHPAICAGSTVSCGARRS